MQEVSTHALTYLDKTNVRSNGVNDPEEVRLLRYIDADAEVGALALDCLE